MNLHFANLVLSAALILLNTHYTVNMWCSGVCVTKHVIFDHCGLKKSQDLFLTSLVKIWLNRIEEQWLLIHVHVRWRFYVKSLVNSLRRQLLFCMLKTQKVKNQLYLSLMHCSLRYMHRCSMHAVDIYVYIAVNNISLSQSLSRPDVLVFELLTNTGKWQFKSML